MNDKINMRDVARVAGVSVATVSHVINNTKNVSPSTKKKVEDAINELGYVLNSVAQSFKTGTRKMIGCIIPDISNYFWAKIIEEIEATLSSFGYHLIIINTKETAQKELEAIKILSSSMVDGLIIGSTLGDATEINGILPRSFPVVFIDRTPDNCMHDSSTISNYTSIFDAVRELIQHGHEKIGYIAGLARLSTSKERLQGYYDALLHHGLPINDSFIQCGNSMYTSALQPLITLINEGCTAIITSNNVMSYDVMNYLYREREHLQSTIDVVGYQEGYRDVSFAEPFGLINQPSERMGQWAAQQIITRINNPDSPLQNFTLSSSLTLFKSKS